MRYLNVLTTLLCASSTVAQSYLPDLINGQEFPALIDATTEDLVTGLESGLFTSVDLVEAYVARINQVNGTLHCVTELDPDAIARAQQADALRANGTILSPLHGIPILIKNNIATGPGDAMNNTAGSYALLGATVAEPSTIVKKLRAAGAIVLGKTNLSQWANYRSSNSSNGWSAYGGQTYGAYYPMQDPSGSSSGSGVASSIGLALAALGTETSGSILSPSNVNNLVGIKPTVGLTSRYLVIPISEHQDTIGPMARNVKDAAYILQAIAGPDPNDNYTLANPFNGSLPDYVEACDFSAFAGARIGIPRNVLDLYSNSLAQPVLDAFYEAVSQIEAAGAVIVDANYTAFEEYANSDTPGILGADFISNLAGYLDDLTYNPYDINDLEELRNFTQSFGPEDYPDRDTAVWDSALEAGYNNTSPEFWEAYQRNLYFGGPGGILGALERTNTSAVILPTDISAGIPALVGSPVITVPLGFYPANTTVEMNRRGNLVDTAPNIPFGISFLGARWSEADLIGFAYAYEQRTMHRDDVLPYIVPNLELSDFV